MRLLETIFSITLTASLASTFMILLVLLIRKLFLRRLSPGIILALWLLVLIKLLVPIAPQSPVSLFNLVPQAMHDDLSWQTDFEFRPEPAASDDGHPIPAAASNPASASSSAQVQPDLQSESAPSAKDRLAQLSWQSIASLAWLGGLLALGSFYLFIALRFNATMRTSLKLDDEEALSILEACKEQLGIRQPIALYETSRLQSPCLYGLIKPGIYLPEDIVGIADSRQLTHILLHELTHYRRKDLWFNSLWTLALWLHWYNPAVWLAIKKMKADREVACDAGVLDALGEREASSYGMTLLMLSRLVARSASPRVNLSHFFENHHEMKRRITMIAKFKKSSSKLTVAAMILVLALGAVLLPSASKTANSAGVSAPPEHPNSLKIQRLNDYAKWFSTLDRANDYAGFRFKVPDYLPAGYRLENVGVLEKYVKQADNLASATFVSNFGQFEEQIIELVASKGNLLETHDLVWGTGNIAPWTWGAAKAYTYRHDEVTIAGIQGTLVTQTQSYESHEPEIANSFVWNDKGVWYALNYYSENHTMKEGLPYRRRNVSQGDLAKMVRSFAYPEQIRQVRYDGEGNSFPLYEKQDLEKAENILGFKTKFPLSLSNSRLQLIESVLLRAEDRNTGYTFRPDEDTIKNSYRARYDTRGFELNDEIAFYQSKAPLVDVTKLTAVKTIDVQGVDVIFYDDTRHVYDPYGLGADNKDKQTQSFGLWKQNGIYYTASFLGLESLREESIKDLALAPVR
ncbi:M56 family metallopeptidase [Cohnella suwonensis]|uniref:M56 family metallopeptidase n=1 Tax=Cohnella suwonensis TaxID=696072 RepID=A0ABW0LU63_9BACL